MEAELSKPDWTRDERRIVQEIPWLRAFLRRLIRREDEAEDVLQDALERAWRYRGSLRPEGSARGWLGKLAFRAHVDRRRRQGRAPREVDAELQDLAARTQGDPGEEVREVAALIERLPGREREVLLRFHQDGESIAAIAASLGCAQGTVKSRLHRGRRRLLELRGLVPPAGEGEQGS